MTTRRQTIKNDNKGIVYCTPQDDVVQLPKIHLIDQFRKFKEAITLSRISLSDILSVIGLWLPIVTTSTFKTIFGLSADAMMGGYIVLATIITLIIFKPLGIFLKGIFSEESRKKYETDPEIRVKNIISGQGTPDGVNFSKNELYNEIIKNMFEEHLKLNKAEIN